MAIITRLLTPQDITNGVFEGVFRHFELAFPPDERRERHNVSFRDDQVLRTLRGLEELVVNPKTENSQAYFLGRFIGEDEEAILAKPYETFRAGMVVYVFPATSFAFAEYLFSASGYRQKGAHGIKIVQDAIKTFLPQVKRIFGEVEREVNSSDPEVCTQIRQRLALFEKLGGLPLFADYIQPSYSEEKNPVPLHPVLFNLDGADGIKAEDFIKFLNAFYQDVYGFPPHSEQNKYLRHVMDSIRGHSFVEQRKRRYTSEDEKFTLTPYLVKK